MNKKIVALIAGTKGTKITLLSQLEDYIGSFANIYGFAIDEGLDHKINADLIIVSTDLILEDALKYMETGCPIIVAKRIINYSEIEKLLYIPNGETILFVNDCVETSLECIEWLKKLGITNYNFIPYYPGCIFNKEIKYAVSPGETELIPKFIPNKINIGPRLIDMTTISEILKFLNAFEKTWGSISEMYLSKIVNMGKLLDEISREKTQAYDNIIKIMDNVNEGILAFNNKGIITVFNENLKILLGVKKTNIIGSNINSIIRDRELYDFIKNSMGKESTYIDIRGEQVHISFLHVEENNLKVVIFKHGLDELMEEKSFKKDIYNKGYFGKYIFKDIIGISDEIVKTKGIAEKFSSTDLTVLIEGASGTGKELFASSIHNNSSRKDFPFVAVNFSSLSENLVESELFGYEEGAFTGAIKGGKAGIFEQAEGGTIFLDEIGDISPRIQSRLLRVLQEKEIMPVGGNKIIHVNIRVIAATNQNLRKLVEEKKFRSDLYHRLKVLYLKLPPLEKRKEDILPLVEYFLRLEGKEHISLNEDVKRSLIKYPFNGNVRELKNTLDYMLTVCDGREIKLSDLPEESFFHENINIIDNINEEDAITNNIRIDYIYILKALYSINKNGEKGSRTKILNYLDSLNIHLSDQMIRSRLDYLSTLGYIDKKRGKSGTSITSKGVDFLINSCLDI